MSTMTRSSTPKQAMRRPDPGTTMPPATCSVRTEREVSSGFEQWQGKRLTETGIAEDTGLVGFGRDEIRKGRPVTYIVPTYHRVLALCSK